MGSGSRTATDEARVSYPEAGATGTRNENTHVGETDPVSSSITDTLRDVELPQGFNLSKSWVKRIEVLDWIYDHGGESPGAIVDLGSMFEDQSEADRQTLGGFIQELSRDGLFNLMDGLDWTGTATSAGITLTEEYRELRSNPARRAQALRDAVVQWIYAENMKGLEPNSTSLPQSEFQSYYNSPWTKLEIDKAVEWLAARQQIKGIESFGPGLSRMQLLPAGEDMIEAGVSMNEPPRNPTGPINFNVDLSNTSGIVNFAAFSQNTNQSANSAMTNEYRTVLEKLADDVTEYVPALRLTPADQERATTVAQELRELSEEPVLDRSRAAKLLDAVQAVALGGTGGAFGDGLVALTQAAAQALGISA